MYPRFLGIGAQKAGTTWLSRTCADTPVAAAGQEIHCLGRRAPDQRLFGKATPMRTARVPARSSSSSPAVAATGRAGVGARYACSAQ
jgi:hypothetical protein